MYHLHTHWLSDAIHYDGSQLRSHWVSERTGIVGDGIVAFAGGARVDQHMVDMEDRLRKSKIFSEHMLHFVIEHFHFTLLHTIALQHLLVAITAEAFRAHIPTIALRRMGNDLFENDAKLTISIATASPISSLMHLGINIVSANTPVKTKGLADYRIDPQPFAEQIMLAYSNEVGRIWHARTKVRAVP